jgi:uncharacterized Zn finger protein
VNRRDRRTPGGSSSRNVAYTKDQLLDWVGAKTYDKALSYVDAVSDIRRSPDKLHAYVSGTAAAPYFVEIIFRNGLMDGFCTCPVGFNCKHVAATLLACVEREERASNVSVSRRTVRIASVRTSPCSSTS